MPPTSVCENDGCNRKISPTDPVYQRFTKDGKSVLMCRKCAIRNDGKEIHEEKDEEDEE